MAILIMTYVLIITKRVLVMRLIKSQAFVFVVLQNLNDKNDEKNLPITSGFARAGVYARSNICADIQVCSPHEHL